MKRLATVALTLALSAPGGTAVAHETEPVKPRTPRTPRTPQPVEATDPVESGGRTTEHQPPSAAPSSPAPAPTASPAPEPHAHGGSVADRIAATWPGDDQRILRIARCESNLNPRAVNPSSGTTGVLQIHPIWRGLAASMGYSWAGMKRVEPNVRVGWAVREIQGYGAWVCK